MKFNLTLDESLFDDSYDLFEEPTPKEFSEYDDEFIDYEDEHSLEDVPKGPAEGSDTGVSGEIIALINDEWEAIEGYNNAIASLRANISDNPFYEKAISVLEEISAEENQHVGQLQEVLKHISPNAAKIDTGEKEARSQLGLVGGKLPVQAWETKDNTADANMLSNNNEEICMLCDVDDEM